MRSDTWLLKYREAIRRGEIHAGMDMIMELDNLIADLDDDQYLYDTKDADLRIDFIESCIKLTKSPFYGAPMILLLWQKAFIEVVYSFKIISLDSGKWVDRFQEILLLISRKCGKTEFIAALMLTELLLGRPGSDIVCSGTNDGTADICYQAIDTMRLLIDPKSVDTWRNQKGIKCFATKSFIFKMSDSTKQKEGRNIDMAGLDEVWSLLDDGIYKPIQQSAGTKEYYKIFMFGSEGFVDEGFLDDQLKKYRKIIRGEDDTESSKRKLPWIYSMDSEAEVWETNEQGINPLWEKANPSIGAVKKWSYLRDRVDEARTSKSDRMFVLAKDFNFKVLNGQAWLNKEDFEYPATFNLEDFKGSVALGAVDMAQTTDLTCVKVLLMKKDDPVKYIHTMYFIPEGKLQNSNDESSGAKYKEWAQQGWITIVDGHDVDTAVVADWLYQLWLDYKIEVFKTGYDQRFSKQFTNQMDTYGFDYEMVDQNRKILSNPMKLVETELKAQLINYNENPVDRWCFRNTGADIDDKGFMMAVKQSGTSTKRIDGSVTLIILYEMFKRYRSEFLQRLR